MMILDIIVYVYIIMFMLTLTVVYGLQESGSEVSFKQSMLTRAKSVGLALIWPVTISVFVYFCIKWRK